MPGIAPVVIPIDPLKSVASRLVTNANAAEAGGLKMCQSIVSALAAYPDGGDGVLAQMESALDFLNRVIDFSDTLSTFYPESAIDTKALKAKRDAIQAQR